METTFITISGSPPRTVADGLIEVTGDAIGTRCVVPSVACAAGADFKILRASAATNCTVGIIAKYVDVNNYMLCVYENDACIIKKKVNNKLIVLARETFHVSAGAHFSMHVQCTDNVVVFAVASGVTAGNRFVLQAHDTTPNGPCGLLVFNCTAQIQNFSTRPVPPPLPPTPPVPVPTPEPVPPVPGTTTFDKYGVRKLCASVGREWFNHWDAGAMRAYTWDNDEFDSELVFRGDGEYTIFGVNGDRAGQMQVEGVCPRIYVRSTASEAVPPPGDGPLWNNVEVTFYALSTGGSGESYAGLEAVVKTNHIPDSWAATTSGYGGRVLFDGRVDFEKEVMHTPNTNVRTQPVYPWGSNTKLPLNKWIGYKFLARNCENDSKVRLELYTDTSLFDQGAIANPAAPPSGGAWKLVHSYTDDGKWSTGYGVRPAYNSGKPEYKAEYAAPLTWPNWSVYLRTDALQGPQYYKWFSVREVAPID